MKIKKIAISFGVLLSLIVLFVLADYYYALSLEQTFMLINGDTLLITEASEWEASKPYDYLIKRKDKFIIPESVFFYQWQDAEEPIFELVYSDDNKMVAVVTKQEPKTVYILYDIETGDSVPHQGNTEEVEEYISRRDKMLDKFNKGKHDYVFNKY